MSNAFARLLKCLRRDGAVPASSVSRPQHRRLRPLLETGVLEEVRAENGGRRLRVRRGASFEAFIAQVYPQGLSAALETGPEADGEALPRSRGLALRRTPKRARRTDAEILTLRGLPGTTLAGATAAGKTATLPIGAHTRTYGAAAVLLEEGRRWRCEGPLAIIENLEVFLHFEATAIPAPAACYAGGRLSARMVDWLASEEMAGAEFVFCGDYDPVGVSEYLRLKHARPEQVRFFMPADLDALFARYGRKKLVTDNIGVLQRVRQSPDATAQAITSLIDRHGMGLDQEVLLLDEVLKGSSVHHQRGSSGPSRN